MIAASTVSTPPPSVTLLTTPASVMMMETVTPGISVTQAVASVYLMCVRIILTVLDLMPPVMWPMTTASTAAQRTVLVILMDAVKVNNLYL